MHIFMNTFGKWSIEVNHWAKVANKQQIIMYRTVVYTLVNVVLHIKNSKYQKDDIAQHLTLRQFHVGFHLSELEGLGLELELGLGVGLGASKLLIADCRYATHENRVPVPDHDLKYGL